MPNAQTEGYKVIALRWRPKQFDEIVGQEHIVKTLKNAILNNRIAHAFLFVGPRGTGKTTTARIFAKALNCEGGPSISPDDNSPLCKAIMDGSCMDVIEIDGASNNNVDNIRDIREQCQYAPAQGKFKIYIIDEVHMLSKAAFNALLKVLEEPPPHVKFIFATTEADKVLDTIVSRCQRFEFRPIPDEKIVAQLKRISKAEGIKITDEALHSIARLANGGMRDAQSILDQLISFCGKEIDERSVIDVYGLASAAQVRELAAALVKADYAALVNLSDKLADEGRDLNRVLVDAQALLRGALLRAVRENGETDALGAPARTEQLLRIIDTLHTGEFSLSKALSEKANFEAALLKAAQEGRSRPIDSLIRELSDIANALPQEDGKKKIAPAPSAVQAAEAPEPNIADVLAQAAPTPEATPADSAPESDAGEPDSDSVTESEPDPDGARFPDEPPLPSYEEPAPEDADEAHNAPVPAAAPVAPPMRDTRPPDSDITWERVPEPLRALMRERLHAVFRPARRFDPKDLH